MEYHRYVIPNELLIKIFRGVVATAIQPSNIPHTPFTADSYRHNDHFILRCNTTTQLRLICRHWDQIILCDPWFWSQICITISREYSRRPPPRLVEKWLERSGTHTLDISLTFPNLFHPIFEREEDMEECFNVQMALFSRRCGKMFHWRTKFPKWLKGRIELPSYKSLLHSNSGHRNLALFMTQFCDRMRHCCYQQLLFRNMLARGYFTFNVWPVLKRTSFRWRSLALTCEMDDVTTFFRPIFCELRELSELLLDLRHFRSDPFAELPRLFESIPMIPSILRLSVSLNFRGVPYPERFDSYNRILHTALRNVTYLEVTDSLSPKEAIIFMEACESATFIKMGHVAAAFSAPSIPPSLSSRLRLSALTTLILSISWVVNLLFDHLDLPNLRILQIIVPKWLNCASTMLVSSLITSITTIKSLQILHLNHDYLSFHEVLQFLSRKQIQLIPVLEIGPLFLEQIDSPPISEERALRETLCISPSFARCLLVGEMGSGAHVFGWVDERVVEEWGDDLREGGVELSIVGVHRRRQASH